MTNQEKFNKMVEFGWNWEDVKNASEICDDINNVVNVTENHIYTKHGRYNEEGIFFLNSYKGSEEV